MLYILDTETTGTDPAKDDVIQLACLVASIEALTLPCKGNLLTERNISDTLDKFRFEILFNNCYLEYYKTDKKISPGAMSTHHITHAELEAKAKCTMEQDLGSVNFSKKDYIVGHNIDFDWKMIKQPPAKRICTLALSRYLWPQLDSHKLSALIYAHDETLGFSLAKNAHDARMDVLMCYYLLALVVEELKVRGEVCLTEEDLWLISEKARVPTIMPFGKHKGEAIKDVPFSYVAWYIKLEDVDPYLLKAFYSLYPEKLKQNYMSRNAAAILATFK